MIQTHRIYGFLFMAFITLQQPLAFGQVEIIWKDLQAIKVAADKKDSKPVVPDELKKKLDTKIKIKGFMMPLDFEAKEVAEFLLVPYVPSCMHVPPPPPNQIIFVKLAQKSKYFYGPIEAVGKVELSVQNFEFTDAYLKMTAERVSEIKNK
jgi:hypothetical protein